MNIVVYASEKPIYLCDAISPTLSELTKLDDTLHLSGKEQTVGNDTLINFESSKYKCAVINDPDFDSLKMSFFGNFTLIEAAGGVVENVNGEFLFIYRRGKWDLPKGKIEPGENAETCAEREIEEETGVDQLDLIRKITETYHIYREKGKTILKTSHWFHFISKSEKMPVPQTEEDITSIEWVSEKNIEIPLENTYQNIKDVIGLFQENAS